MSSQSRTVLAALLLAVPVTLEAVSVLPSHGWGHLFFAATQLAGWTLILTVCRALATHATGGRWGPRLTQTGVVALLLFAAAYLATYLAAGEPAGWVFWLFLLGFVCLTIGGLVWARALRRTSSRRAGIGLALVSVLGFAAMAVGDNVFHDIALNASYLAWILVGRGAPTRPATSGGDIPDGVRSSRTTILRGR